MKENRYFSRTLQHIHRVHKNMLYLITECSTELKLTLENKRKLMMNVLHHDISKFSSIQCVPYIELTEYYHQRKVEGNKDYDYPSEDMKDNVDRAIQSHYMNENHHPESGDILDFYSCVEIVCDLQAMAQEFNEVSCRKYFEDVWLKKHSTGIVFFETEHFKDWKELMYLVITLFEMNRNTRTEALYIS